MFAGFLEELGQESRNMEGAGKEEADEEDAPGLWEGLERKRRKDDKDIEEAMAGYRVWEEEKEAKCKAEVEKEAEMETKKEMDQDSRLNVGTSSCSGIRVFMHSSCLEVRAAAIHILLRHSGGEQQFEISPCGELHPAAGSTMGSTEGLPASLASTTLFLRFADVISRYAAFKDTFWMIATSWPRRGSSEGRQLGR